METPSLVYVGKIIEITPIEGADFIVSATVICGHGGKWRGIVRKEDFKIDDYCIVFLPDSQLDPDFHSYLPFMKDSGWRVKMRRFKGAPSEVLIIQPRIEDGCIHIGQCLTHHYRVTKYSKPLPNNLNGAIEGDFPSFIPKTDEPNYQKSADLIKELVGKPYYITEKADGSSTTAYRYKGHFGLCSRNYELKRNEDNGYWKVAIENNLEETLPEGYALQWETCGPSIQKNPMGLTKVDGFAFSAYKIDEHRYLELDEFIEFCKKIAFKTCRILTCMPSFSEDGIDKLGEGTYANGKPREGVVVRSQGNVHGVPISFKVINLDYET